ncbi:MAG: hypothetical protein QM703_04100 [Gemmatales bacterium]
MKKRHYTFWRWLLALLVGAGTWWLVGWWLGPHVYFEAEYSDSVDDPKLTEEEELLAQLIRKLGGRRAHVTLWDRGGRYMLLDQAYKTQGNRYSLLDLTTKGIDFVMSSDSDASMMGYDSIRFAAIKAKHLANPDGTKQCVSLAFPDHPTELEHDFTLALWEWNPFADEVRRLKSFPHARKLAISHDGTMLLEVDQCSPLWPSLLMPLSITNVTGALSQVGLQTNTLTIFRLWPLPDVTLRSTIAVQSMEQSRYSLSEEGDYLIQSDNDVLPRGFTSNRFVENDAKIINVAPNFGPDKVRTYFFSPSTFRIFETRSGNLYWSQSSPKKSFQRIQSTAHLIGLHGWPGDGMPTLLHLPSKTLIANRGCFQDARLNWNAIHAVVHDNHEYRLAVITDGGQISYPKVPIEKDKTQMTVIANAPQVLVVRYSENADRLPAWLGKWLSDRSWFISWLTTQRAEYSIIDYEKGRTLWSVEGSNEKGYYSECKQTCEVTPHWLIVHNSNDESGKLRLQIYSLPFPSWSPWWACVAGLLVLILVLFFLRPRRGITVTS